jgi:hypothetical protein
MPSPVPRGYPVTPTDRPDWAEGLELCPVCATWRPVTKARCLRAHKRQDPDRWRMVPCGGSGVEVITDQTTTS